MAFFLCLLIEFVALWYIHMDVLFVIFRMQSSTLKQKSFRVATLENYNIYFTFTNNAHQISFMTCKLQLGDRSVHSIK